MTDKERTTFTAIALEVGMALASPASAPAGAATRDIAVLVDFILGWWPGLEDGISWGDGIDHDTHPVFLAAKRLAARGSAAGEPSELMAMARRRLHEAAYGLCSPQSTTREFLQALDAFEAAVRADEHRRILAAGDDANWAEPRP